MILATLHKLKQQLGEALKQPVSDQKTRRVIRILKKTIRARRANAQSS